MSTRHVVDDWLSQGNSTDRQLHSQIRDTLKLSEDEQQEVIEALFSDKPDVASSARLVFGGAVLNAAYDHNHLLEITGTDARTGAASQREMERWLTSLYGIGVAEQRRQERLTPRPLGIVAVDLINFKQINEVLGEPIGHLILRAAVDSLKRPRRNTDRVVRVGGDEFLVLLSDISEPDMEEVHAKLQGAERDKVTSRAHQEAWRTIKAQTIHSCEVGPVVEDEPLAERRLLINGVAVTTLGTLALAATGMSHATITSGAREEAFETALSTAISARDTEKKFLHQFTGTYRTFDENS